MEADPEGIFPLRIEGNSVVACLSADAEEDREFPLWLGIHIGRLNLYVGFDEPREAVGLIDSLRNNSEIRTAIVSALLDALPTSDLAWIYETNAAIANKEMWLELQQSLVFLEDNILTPHQRFLQAANKNEFPTPFSLEHFSSRLLGIV